MSITVEQPVSIDRDGIVRKIGGDRADAFLPSPCVQNHAANLMPLPDGSLGCVWFGGTQEGVPDISAYFSRLDPGSDVWSAPMRLSDDPKRSEQNPLLFPAPDGKLWLIWTAQISGNQDTALVRYRVSADNGRSWGEIATLFEAPASGGIFMRQPVVVLDNGDWLLPVWYCKSTPGKKWVGDQDTAGVMISTDQGRIWRENELPDSLGCVHMSIVDLRDGTLAAFFRSRWADNVYACRSTDQGRTWTAPAPIGLPNNNSSIQVTRLANGHLAMVYNHSSAADATERRVSLYDDIEDDTDDGKVVAAIDPTRRTTFWGVPRAPMTLAISEDGGATWPHRRNIEVGDGYCMTNNSREGLNREFSYPSIVQTSDGALHVAFTYYRQAIKYVRLTEDWVRAA